MSKQGTTLAELGKGLNWSSLESLSAVGGTPYLLIDLSEGRQLASNLRPECPLLGIGDLSTLEPEVLEVMDVVVPDGTTLDAVIDGIVASPVAASVLTGLARHNEAVSVEDGLLAESLAYSTLQHGEQFQTWLKGRTPVHQESLAEVLLVERSSTRLNLTFNRPEKHNAYSAQMRDALAEALQLALADDSIKEVMLQGAGPSFCSGGDLEEFGEARDAALAHLVRMTRSVARLMFSLRKRMVCHIHGACLGAGIELPAFCDRIIAHPSTYFTLPEVAFGLVPGAGGSVSLVKRIGRHRFNYMALSGQKITAETALDWGLVDVVTE